MIQTATICPHAIRWVAFNQSTIGFGSTIINLLGLAEYCERHEIDLHFNPKGIVAIYLDGDSDPWHSVFRANALSIRNGHDRKWGVRLNLPPSFPFFNYMTCCDDRTLFISDRWAASLHSVFSRHLRFTDEMMVAFENDRTVLGEGRIMGVHLRGTDHASHGRTLTVDQRLDQVESRLEHDRFDALFVMTDERGYLDAAIRRFGGMVRFLTGVERSASNAPLHHDRKVPNGTKILTDLVREAVLMSNCEDQVLARSGVSAFVRCLNPSVRYNLFEEDLSKHDLTGWKNGLIDQSTVECISLR